MAHVMSRLHKRVQQASDEVKSAARAAEKLSTRPARRPILPGDKLWLVYSDSERSRYFRKHGHGRPWRHAFVVKRVKPHAVLLRRTRSLHCTESQTPWAGQGESQTPWLDKFPTTSKFV